MKTVRLHYDDPLRLQLESVVLAHGEWDGMPSVVLDRTVFYPESGGQLGDRGTLGQTQVIDVQVADDGVVHHLVEGERPAVGETACGRVDERRRREHMALHTGQHALSRAVLDQLGAVTVSSRLGASACTIDVDVAELTIDQLRPAEDAVNSLIDEDRPVRQAFTTAGELETLRLRKPPPRTDRVRVVDIEGWDVTPCGGTHVTHTAQIELLWVQSVEKYKGGSRITFEAGPRARRALRNESDHLRSVAETLRCAPREVGPHIERLRTKLDAAQAETEGLRDALAAQTAESLARNEGFQGEVMIAAVKGADASLLKAIAAKLAEGSRWVALAGIHDDRTDVLLARGPAASVDCGALMRSIAEATGGRGGGRPDHAQGRLPPGVDWTALVQRAR